MACISYISLYFYSQSYYLQFSYFLPIKKSITNQELLHLKDLRVFGLLLMRLSSPLK